MPGWKGLERHRPPGLLSQGWIYYFLKILLFNNYIYVCYVCVWVPCIWECECPQRLERASDPLEVEYGGCVLLNTGGAGTQIQALSEQNGLAAEPPL